MKQIKFINSTTIKLVHTIYKGYPVGELPKRFAFIYDEDKDQEGITEWFNFKGLTFVEKTENPFAI
jgi:hypothetical protein